MPSATQATQATQAAQRTVTQESRHDAKSIPSSAEENLDPSGQAPPNLVTSVNVPDPHIEQDAPAPLSVGNPEETMATVEPMPEPMDANIPAEVPSPMGQGDQLPTRQITLLPRNAIHGGELWVADTTEKSNAILVLCINDGENGESVARDEKWQKFAKENHLQLAVVAFQSTESASKDGATYLRSGEGSGDMLRAGLYEAFGVDLPLIVCGSGGGGAFAKSFAEWQPDRVLLWAAYTDRWSESLSTGKAAPGLIVCDHEEEQRGQPARKLFARARGMGRLWSWIKLSGPWQARQQQFDTFFIQYAEAFLGQQNHSNHAWVNIDTHRFMSAAECIAEPTEAAWLPSEDLQAPWRALMRETGKLGRAKIVQKTIPTRNPSQPTLQLSLRIPASVGDGKEVSGVIAFCTWENNQNDILGKLTSETNDKPVDLPGGAMVRAIIEFAEVHNLAVLTWGTVEAWDNRLSTEELDRKRQKEFDHGFDMLASAWERGVKELARETGIPKTNYLLYGISRGAQWAHRLALRKPDYFLAVHIHIPSTFDKPTGDGKKPLWLVTTGELDYGYQRAQRFYSECQLLGYPIIFKGIVGIGHAGSSLADDLGWRFFEYALSVRELRDQFERKKKDPFARFGKATPGPWLEAFRMPEFFGDMVNQGCFPVQEAHLIPQTFRVPLPTKILADAWNR